MPDKPEAVETIATSGERLTIVVEQLGDGKIKATSNAWSDREVVIYPDQVLEVRSIDRRMRIARKVRHWDDADRKPTPMQANPYDFIDDTAEPEAPSVTA